MGKWFCLIALAFGLQAHANDSGYALIDVLGVAPATEISKSDVKVYGGDTKALYDVLPVTSVGNWKSLLLLSGQYAVSLNCSEEYDRPTNGEARKDYMCEFKVNTRKEADGWLEEVDKSYVNDSSMTPYSGNHVARVLGISAQSTGEIFSFYGEQAGVLARQLPSPLKFQSAAYTATLACARNYHRPTNNELRNDYMCKLSVSGN